MSDPAAETVEAKSTIPDTKQNSGGRRIVDAPSDLHKIVVVGGGAGGLELVTGLGNKLARRKRADVRLVDRTRTHIWKPLLHEIAAGSMAVGRHELDYLAQAHWHSFRYNYGEMIGLDRTARLVHLASTADEEGRQITPDRWVPYDTLVLAIGSISNDFSTPGVAEHAIKLDTPVEAERFNRRLINACVRAHAEEKEIEPGQLHVTIIGAGATGTELSAELHRTARGLVAYGLDRIDPERDIKITLVEAAPRILPALPERIADATMNELNKLGVEVLTGQRVTEVKADGVVMENGDFVPSALVVWAAGVQGPPVLTDLDGLEVSRANTLVVRDTLQTTKDDNIFVIGDCAYLVPEGEETPIPPRAQAAHQQSSHLLKQIPRVLRGDAPKPFKYQDFGSLVSLGHYTTVGNLMGFISGRSMMIEGLFAKLMYRSLYKMHEVALHGYVKVALDTISRMITRRTEPHIKLH